MDDILLILKNEILEARPDLSVEARSDTLWISDSFAPIALKAQEPKFDGDRVVIKFIYEPNLEIEAEIDENGESDITEIISLIELREMEEGLDPMDLKKAPYEDADDQLSK